MHRIFTDLGRETHLVQPQFLDDSWSVFRMTRWKDAHSHLGRQPTCDRGVAVPSELFSHPIVGSHGASGQRWRDLREDAASAAAERWDPLRGEGEHSGSHHDAFPQ